jgi:hypothetical protein
MKVKTRREKEKDDKDELIKHNKKISDLSSKYHYFLKNSRFSNHFLYLFLQYSNIDICMEEVIKYIQNEDRILLSMIYKSKREVFLSSSFYKNLKNIDMFKEWILWDKDIYKWIVNDWDVSNFYLFFSTVNSDFLWKDLSIYEFFYKTHKRIRLNFHFDRPLQVFLCLSLLVQNICFQIISYKKKKEYIFYFIKQKFIEDELEEPKIITKKIFFLLDSKMKKLCIESLFDFYNNEKNEVYKDYLEKIVNESIQYGDLFKIIFEEIKKRKIYFKCKEPLMIDFYYFFKYEDFDYFQEILHFLQIKDINYLHVLHRIFHSTDIDLQIEDKKKYILFLVEKLSINDISQYIFQYYQPPLVYTSIFLNLIDKPFLLDILLDKKYDSMNHPYIQELDHTQFEECQIKITEKMKEIFSLDIDRKSIINTVLDHIFLISMIHQKEENIKLLFKYGYEKHKINLDTVIQLIYFTGGKRLTNDFWRWFFEKNGGDFDSRLFSFWLEIGDYGSIEDLLDLGYSEAILYVDKRKWVKPSFMFTKMNRNQYTKDYIYHLFDMERDKNIIDIQISLLERLYQDGYIKNRRESIYIGEEDKEWIYQSIKKDCYYCIRRRDSQILPEEEIEDGCICSFYQKMNQFFLQKGFIKNNLFWKYPTHYCKGFFK